MWRRIILPHSLAARIWLKPLAGNAVFSAHDILLDGVGNRSQAVEYLMLAGHLIAMEITGGRARTRRVHFRHQPLSSLRTYRQYFRCEVVFGQKEDGVAFSAQDLACPITDPDADAYRQMTAFIETRFTRQLPPLSAQVHGVVRQFLGSPLCSNDWTAARLNLHPAHLAPAPGDRRARRFSASRMISGVRRCFITSSRPAWILPGFPKGWALPSNP